MLAIPGDKLDEALNKLKGIQGKTVIDATNLIKTNAPGVFNSNAGFVKSKTEGPTAKSFNINFASLYGQLGAAHVKPSNLWNGRRRGASRGRTALSRRRLRPGFHGHA